MSERKPSIDVPQILFDMQDQTGKYPELAALYFMGIKRGQILGANAIFSKSFGKREGKEGTPPPVTFDEITDVMRELDAEHDKTEGELAEKLGPDSPYVSYEEVAA